ncbi:MAG: PP2C family protein-serine/threonine phosphatase [Phycisphaerae bacterium]
MYEQRGRGTERGWLLTAWQRPAEEAGGDFIVTKEVGHTLRVFVGDIAGHGNSAARAVELIRPMIERDLGGTINEATLRRWSKAVGELLPDRFVAMTCIQVDRDTGRATILNAGNPQAIILRRDRDSIEYVRSNGMPLGLVDEDEWRAPSSQTFTLAAGDELICFTDGLPDTLGVRDRGRFGVDRIVSALSDHAEHSPVQSLRHSVCAFADDSTDQDDVTVLWIGGATRWAA